MNHHFCDEVGFCLDADGFALGSRPLSAATVFDSLAF